MPTRALITILTISVVLSIDAAPPQAFLSKYCLECHDAETEKGKVNLEGLSHDSDMRLLFDIYDQTILEQMPPEKKKQPSISERQAFVD